MPRIGLNQIAWRSIRALSACQFVIMTSMIILCGIISGTQAAYSACLAGVCCIVPTLIFAMMVFRQSGAQAAILIARTFYRAEAMKWLVTALLMTSVFIFFPIVAMAFFATFCVMQLSYWVMIGFFRFL